MSEADEVAYEAGVASFPIDPGHCERSCAACADASDAWAWRVADIMPDSAQSRMDALADAETLRRYLREYDGIHYRYGSALNFNWTRRLRRYRRCPPHVAERLLDLDVRESARTAFRAVPGLRQ